MTEILFYHLQRQPLERVLPTLLEKSLERGWRVVVQAASGRAAIEALDAHLWIFRTTAFCRMAPGARPRQREQPVLLTVQDSNPTGAAVWFLVDSRTGGRWRL